MMQTGTTRLSATRRITMLGMLSAVAFVFAAVGRFPLTSVEFLKYDPKDIVIVFAGLLYGPLSALIVSVVASTVEMLALSHTGGIGLIMNVLSTASFACTASAVYKRRQTQRGAVSGLLLGTLMMTAVMLLWNYLITPLYMGLPREQVMAMLLPIFLPFNLIKGALNAALTLLLYKPLVGALRGSGMLPPRDMQESGLSGEKSTTMVLLCGVVLATCVLLILVLRGVL